MISKRVRTLLWKLYLLKDAILKKKVYTELSNLAKILEEDVFRRLLEKGALEVSIDVTGPGLKISPSDSFIPVSEDAAGFFKNLGVSRIEADTCLESNQMMDILKDIYAMKHSSIAAEGYNAYCAITRFFPETGLLSIKYHYCELDYSKAVRGIKEASGYRDHRVFFEKAARFGILTGIAVVAAGLTFPYLPRQLSVILSIMAGIWAGIIVFIAMQVLGSLEYDKEYLEKRLKERE